MHRRQLRDRAPMTAVAWLALVCGTAGAHTTTEATAPADGAMLSVPPDAIVLTFDAPMRVTVIRLVDETGETFDLERSDGMAPVAVFRATPPPLLNGRYTVDWRGLSSDGHAMQCRFSFEVAQ